MTVKAQSYITLPSKIVADACEKKIAHIKEKRKESDDEWLKKHRGNIRKYSFLGIQFGPVIRPQTDQEVYAATSFEGLWNARSIYAWGTLDTAEKLLRIAKSGAKYVNVTAEDWDQIS